MTSRVPVLCAVGVVLAVLVGGCGEPASDAGPRTAGESPGNGAGAGPSTATPTSAPANATMPDPAPAPVGGEVGKGKGCTFPAQFKIPARWRAGDVSDAGVTAGQGIRMACEIDGKPAGVIGFIRVWVADAGTGRTVRDQGKQFLAEWAKGHRDLVERDVQIAGREAVEYQYQEADKRTRFFVAGLSTATIIVEWAGLDQEEHEGGLPAYTLARSTITG